jgi:hypothetical protein
MYKYLGMPCLVFAGYCQLIARTVEPEVESDVAVGAIVRKGRARKKRKTDLGSAQR